ncbi:Signal peptide peptidase-like 2C [Cichlidogyrus casuarinus]|uniref:Signal peptide peptidase-like 2C n=1 Tax=Cichlidogyrus casuarinus TaxID=1844966 RepID=A0ABD2QEW2_9PLAT
MVSALFLLMTVYDVFMVYITPLFKHIGALSQAMQIKTDESVMSLVATGKAGSTGLQLPIALRLEINEWYPYDKSLLGYGDILLPIFMTNMVAFYEKMWEKKRPVLWCTCLVSNVIGLVLAVVQAKLMHQGQPALLFLCPVMWTMLVIAALLEGGILGFTKLWNYELPVCIQQEISCALEEEPVDLDKEKLNTTIQTN